MTLDDVSDFRITDDYSSAHNKVRHVYFVQELNGFEIFNAVGNLNYLNGRFTSFNSAFVSHASKRYNTTTPSLDGKKAVESLMRSKGITGTVTFISFDDEDGTYWYSSPSASEDIPVKLGYYFDGTEIRLAWDMAFYTLDQQNWYHSHIDAITGTVLNTYNWVSQCNIGHDLCELAEHKHMAAPAPAPAAPAAAAGMAGANDYLVYAYPVETPSHGLRTAENSPWWLIASPYGWHDFDGVTGADTNITWGNNVHAYIDDDNNGRPTDTADNPSGGTTFDFSFPIDLTLAPSNYRPAATVNLFYWNNIIHDILYRYGFDEVSGNFQWNNYGKGGLGGDYVRAEAQDGGGLNNANFGTPRDGFRPRMQMYIWTLTSPRRDGDFDNGIIAHEYGHGVSNRLTGGPSNVSCLGGNEQMGEGWSDYFAIALTIDSSIHVDTSRRGVGTYVLGQSIYGKGIRTWPYSTDTNISQYTYDHIKTFSVPHGVGSVWNAMLWDMTWAFINQYGYDPDWYTGTKGNHMAMQLVMDGMKLQACNPGFVTGRDAILEADRINYAGVNECLIWEAFARRGLGYSAYQGVARLRGDGKEAFDLPHSCKPIFTIDKIANKDIVEAGKPITYSVIVRNGKQTVVTGVKIEDTLATGLTYVAGSATAGGVHSAGIVRWSIDTMLPGQIDTLSFQAKTDSSIYSTERFFDNMEYGPSNWTSSASTGTNTWTIDSTNPYAGKRHWYGIDNGSTSVQNLMLNKTVAISSGDILRFKHMYNFEDEWDGGILEISTDSGGSWTDARPYFIKNGYDTLLRSTGPLGSGTYAFTGASLSYIQTEVDLTSFAGDRIIIRFRIATDAGAGSYGWYIDNVRILNEVNYTNTVYGSTAEGDFDDATVECGTSVRDPALPVTFLDFSAIAREAHIDLYWETGVEVNNKGFHLLRTTDVAGGTWEKITWKDGINSIDGGQYHHADLTAKPGVQYYYRLEQEDFDGATSFSEVVAARISAGNIYVLDVYPNPFTDNIRLVTTNLVEGDYTVEVVNGVGAVVAQYSYNDTELNNGVTIETSNLGRGIYFVQLEVNGQRLLKKLVKE